MRDNRRVIYDRFLTSAQMLLHACEAYKAARPPDKEKAKANLESASTSFWAAYHVVETVAGAPLFETARIYGYRLWELTTELGSTIVMGPENFDAVRPLILPARRNTVAAMRADLGLGGNPASDINPFAGTSLEEKYASGEQSRPGPLVL
jgi:hypothetical protein